MTTNTNLHWHAGHNVSGFLPESDEPNTYTTWHDALASLVADLERAWDDADTMLDGDAQYLEAHTLMHGATEGQDFLTYTATHPDSAHDIPTAWWITSCDETDCLAEDDDDADDADAEYDAGVTAGTAAGQLAARTDASTITPYDPDRTPFKDGYADGFVAGYHGAEDQS